MRTTERTEVLRYFFRRDRETPVDRQIKAVLDKMQAVGVLHEEYPKLMTHLERLYELKAKERLDPVSRDTMATIAGNLIGILLIVAYEQKHVMTSRAFTQIIRPK